MNNYLKSIIFRRYLMNLLGSVFIIFFSLFFYNESIFWKVILGISVIYFIIYLGIYINKKIELYKTLDGKLNKEYKEIENCIFTKDEIISFSYDKVIEIKYKDIIKVQHGDNTWEKIWGSSKYIGNHKISISNSNSIITILVKNEEITSLIMSFIKTKNNSCRIVNIPQEMDHVAFDDLEDWKVDNRFGNLK